MDLAPGPLYVSHYVSHSVSTRANDMSARILIVEDEHIVAADLEMKLTQLGYQVVGSAITGEEAISLAERFRPDVVLMDIQLRGPMDGTEAADAIRTGSGTPIIFVTAFAGLLPRDTQNGALPEMCLSKPFSATELKDKLQAVLRRSV
jgi:DNA-binding response OmpR family regulator